MNPPSARDRAIVMITKLLDNFPKQAEWRHTDVAEIVDVLIEAAREPVSDHTRAMADETKRDLRDRGGRARRTAGDDGAGAVDPERPA